MTFLISLSILLTVISLSVSYHFTVPKVEVTNTNLGYKVTITTPQIEKTEEILDSTIVGRYTFFDGKEKVYSIKYIISRDGIRTEEEPVFEPSLQENSGIDVKEFVKQPSLLDERNGFLGSDLNRFHSFLQQNPITPPFLPMREDPVLRAFLFGEFFNEEKVTYVENARGNFFDSDDEKIDSDYEDIANTLANKNPFVINNQYFTPHVSVLQIPSAFLIAAPDADTEKNTTASAEDIITEPTEKSPTMEDTTDKDNPSVNAKEDEDPVKIDEENSPTNASQTILGNEEVPLENESDVPKEMAAPSVGTEKNTTASVEDKITDPTEKSPTMKDTTDKDNPSASAKEDEDPTKTNEENLPTNTSQSVLDKEEVPRGDEPDIPKDDERKAEETNLSGSLQDIDSSTINDRNVEEVTTDVEAQ